MLFTILKMITTSGFVTALECTKFIVGRGSVPDLARGSQTVPQTRYCWLKGPTSKWKGTGRRERREERGGKERKQEGWPS